MSLLFLADHLKYLSKLPFTF